MKIGHCWGLYQSNCHGSWFHVFVLCLVSYVLVPCPLVSSPVFLPLCFPLLCMFVSPCLPALFPLWFPFVISPAVPPHLFLISSSVSVYLVSAFPPACVCQFVASVGVMFFPSSSRLQSPSGMSFSRFWFLVFFFGLIWTLICICYFVFWSLDLFSFVPLVLFSLILPPVRICIWVHL